MKNRMIFD